MQSEHANRIKNFIDKYDKDKIGQWPLEFRGFIEKEPTYKFPLNLLRYNVNNGRIAMEVMEIQEKDGKPLDPNMEEDACVIRELLLNLDKGKTEELKRDLVRVGQEQPGVITHDGIVINGNRRMAIFEDLHENVDSSGKWERLEVIVLPPDVTLQELWKIEAGLQLSQNKVAEYHPVNELLKIKQGLQAGLSAKEMVDVLYGREESEIEDGIARLRIIDNFLKFFGQPNNYGVIKKFGLHEYFINIQKSILKDSDTLGKAEIQKRLVLTFALIRAHIQSSSDPTLKGITHMAIRSLGKIYENPKAHIQYTSTFDNVKDVRTIDTETVLEGFNSAKDVLDIEAEKNKPNKLFERAIRALESIDTESEYFNQDGVRDYINKINDLMTKFNDLY